MQQTNEKLWERAQRYLAERQFAPARVTLESLAQRDPAHVPTRLILSDLAFGEQRVRDAAAQALAATRQLPMDPRLVCHVAAALQRTGESAAAQSCLDHPALQHTQDGPALMHAAVLRKMLGQHPESLALFERARAAGVNHPDFYFQYAQELNFNGHLDASEAALDACLRINPAFGRASLALSRTRKQTAQRNHLDGLGQRLQAVPRGSEDHAAIEFARYKELEDLGRYDEAWQALAQGNAILYGRQSYSDEQADQLFDRLIQRCTPELLQPEKVVNEGPQPIFIIGMPRSGTTLLDRVLGNHSQVVSAGELDDFGFQLRWASDHRVTLDDHVLQRLPRIDYAELGRRYLMQTQWRAPKSRYFTDKLPRNWMVAGLMRRALPQARILNLVRDPMDVCFSNFRAMLGEAFPWSYDQRALAAHYKQYRRVMDHWHAAMPGQILDVPYGELVRDPETMTRKILAFCDLAWEDGCVDVTRNKSAVATPSMEQVREGIHARFFQEWRHYETQLAPLRQALGTMAD